MSLIVTVYTNEGIIMASDSRMSLTTTTTYSDGKTVKSIGSHCTDTTYKTFIANSHVGISACGDSLIKEMPLSSWIMKFIAEKADENDTVEMISKKLQVYFSALDPKLDTHFIIAGYNKGSLTPRVQRLFISKGKLDTVNASSPGATWDGEVSTLQRLLMPVGLKTGNTYSPLPDNKFTFSYFTLQDAINFAEYAIDVTIKTMAFAQTAKTVGGPIDILAIRPDKAFWIKHRELHA